MSYFFFPSSSLIYAVVLSRRLPFIFLLLVTFLRLIVSSIEFLVLVYLFAEEETNCFFLDIEK